MPEAPKQPGHHAQGRKGGIRALPAGLKWVVFLAIVAALSLIVAFGLPRLVPATGRLFEGGQLPSGSLALGLRDAPSSLDIRTKSNPEAERILIPNVYEGLTARDASNQPIPGLASSWSVSSDAKTYAFHLRQAKFSDGSDLTATDVLESFHTETQNKLPGSAMFGAVKAMRAPDGRTLVLTLSHPDPELLWRLSTAPALICKQGTPASAFSGSGSLPAGTGPFTAGRLVIGNAGSPSASQQGSGSAPRPAATLTLSGNPNWHGITNTSAQLRTIHLSWYADSAALATALEKKQVQAAADIGPDAHAAIDKANSASSNGTQYASQSGTSTAQMLVTFNSAPGSLLSDRLIREAHARVLSSALAKQAYGNDADAAAWPIISLDPGYRATGSDMGDFSSYKFEWLQSAYSRKTTMAVAPEVPQSVVDAFAQAEGKAGFSFTATRLTHEQWDEQVASCSADKPMGYDMALWIRHGSHTFGDWTSGQNWWVFDSPDVDEQYRTALRSATAADYEKSMQQAAGTLRTWHPASWLLQLRAVTASRTALGITGLPVAMADSYLPLGSVRLS